MSVIRQINDVDQLAEISHATDKLLKTRVGELMDASIKHWGVFIDNRRWEAKNVLCQRLPRLVRLESVDDGPVSWYYHRLPVPQKEWISHVPSDIIRFHTTAPVTWEDTGQWLASENPGDYGGGWTNWTGIGLTYDYLHYDERPLADGQKTFDDDGRVVKRTSSRQFLVWDR